MKLLDIARQDLWVFLNKQQLENSIEGYLLNNVPNFLIGKNDIVEEEEDDELEIPELKRIKR